MADLCTLADVRTWLQKETADTADDALLTRLIAVVSRDVRDHTGLTFEQATHTLTADGHGGAALTLPEEPATAVTSVTIDGVAIAQSTGTSVPGWVLDTRLNRVVLRGYAFARGVQNVVVVYTAGSASIPANIADIAIRTVAHRYKQKDWIGQASRKMGDDVTTFDRNPWPREVLASLRDLQRVAVG